MGIADVLESIRAHGFSPEAIHYLQEYIRSIEKLAGLNVDVFLPGHGCISLKDGQCHITEALDWLERCLIPPSLL
ncbi:MAG: hypothetical protein JSV31_16550 [Desulfobacterales bacterium]|nr:MAG: hypothetical protein JSV31_16550 [Desulfobacterales bacterium]